MSCPWPCGPPPRDEKGWAGTVMLGPAVREAEGGYAWCREPGNEFALGVLQHPRLWLPSWEARNRRIGRRGQLLSGGRRGAGHGGRVRAVLRAGYPQAGDRRL